MRRYFRRLFRKYWFQKLLSLFNPKMYVWRTESGKVITIRKGLGFIRWGPALYPYPAGKKQVWLIRGILALWIRKTPEYRVVNPAHTKMSTDRSL